MNADFKNRLMDGDSISEVSQFEIREYVRKQWVEVTELFVESPEDDIVLDDPRVNFFLSGQERSGKFEIFIEVMTNFGEQLVARIPLTIN